MTKEELKQKAEEYATKKVGDFKPIQEDKESEWVSCCEDFQKGAEFGYNKANEWHFPSKGELPETSDKYLVYTGGDPFVLEFDTDYNAFGYWVASLGDDWGLREIDFETVKDRGEDDVIAWKEIVLPELPKESE